MQSTETNRLYYSVDSMTKKNALEAIPQIITKSTKSDKQFLFT